MVKCFVESVIVGNQINNYPAEGSINSLTIRRKAEDYIFEVLNEEIAPLKYR